MSGRKTFVGGDILLASEVNGFLMDQAVMVFDDASDRTTYIPSPSEGMVTYLKDINQVQVFNGSSFGPIGQILQVVQGTTTTSTTLTTTSFTDTGVTASITPQTTASKVLVYVSQNYRTAANAGASIEVQFNLLRAATNIGFGSAAADHSISGQTDGGVYTFALLDTPATTSSLTYKVQGRATSIAFGRSLVVQSGSSVSSIILMEVAG